MTDAAPIASADAAPTIRPMTDADIAAAHGLSVEARWPHRAEDWRLMLAVGHGLVACDATGRVLGSAMWWPFGEGLATIGMVIGLPQLQGRGIGRRLMRRALFRRGRPHDPAHLHGGGPAPLRIGGFRVTGGNTQYQGIVNAAAALDDPRVQSGGRGRLARHRGARS